MTSKLELVRKRGSMRERLIVALDVDNLDQAAELGAPARRRSRHVQDRQAAVHPRRAAGGAPDSRARRRDFSRSQVSRYSQHRRQSGHRSDPPRRENVQRSRFGQLGDDAPDGQGSTTGVPAGKAAQADHAGGHRADEFESRRSAARRRRAQGRRSGGALGSADQRSGDGRRGRFAP